jgi:endogenous inhibitor of DNA gyrase (YacG/DUF329 family)
MDTEATTTRRAKPTARERANERTCPNCGGEVVRRSPRGPMPTFCSPECKTQHSNRHIVEGRAVIALLKAWRIDRGTGEIAQMAFAEVCRIVDQFNAQDREANRPRADLYAAKLLADGSQFIDRQHLATARRTRARAEAAAAAQQGALPPSHE